MFRGMVGIGDMQLNMGSEHLAVVNASVCTKCQHPYLVIFHA